MAFHHKVYGLRICSNLPIPGFLVEPSQPEPDVTIEIRAAEPGDDSAGCGGEEPWYASPDIERPGRPTLQVWKRPGAGFRFLYADDTRFEVSTAANRILACSPPGLSLADTAYYLAGPALGFVLRLRGVTGVHASAVLWHGAAVLFTGSTGAGKSTMAAAFSQRGCPVITEDVAALGEAEGQFRVWKGYPRINLWPESVAAVFGSPDALPEIAPPWTKRFLAADPDEFRSIVDPVPIRAIYFLAKREEFQPERAAAMKPAEALVALIGNTYMNYLPGMQRQRRDFDTLSRLAAQVPARRLSALEGNIESACAAVIEDLEGLAG